MKHKKVISKQEWGYELNEAKIYMGNLGGKKPATFRIEARKSELKARKFQEKARKFEIEARKF